VPDSNPHLFRIRNRSPLPGEQDSYGISLNGDQRSISERGISESYGYVALVPNLTGTGYVLMISGLGMSETEAAGELITSPGFSTTLAKILNSKAGKPASPYVQVLFQFSEMSETARASKIAAYRLITPPKSGPP